MINAGHWGSLGNAFVLSLDPLTCTDMSGSNLDVTSSISPHIPEPKANICTVFPFPLLLAANLLKTEETLDV